MICDDCNINPALIRAGIRKMSRQTRDSFRRSIEENGKLKDEDKNVLIGMIDEENEKDDSEGG